ncbi:cation diffusion facilitator family transporter [Alicyclobacillus macrosporangiidus]|uniref:cation diffusion facilitator family transporter n=1 Tax=Alicyclobacillus macrosporangiidus TaxID=392015 RepID=UPI000554615D|nr:cation diffusion facilitator family transporter [Alicyclobacillus macrosporangiidus]MCL6454052.1 cation diffusion facilitator family transporter [Alicyclobacillus sp.]
MAHDHDHGVGHGHGHGGVFHSHAPAGQMKRAFFLTLLILIVEVIGGLISHSLALLSDAGHVLTDIAAIGLSWFALKQGEKPSNEKMTYGYYRSGILAAFINGITLILITLWILWEAYGRFQKPQEITPMWMFISAGVGLLMNLYLGLGMRKEEDLNVKSAVLHMLGDAAASAGVIVGGIIILATKWYVVDPILSVLIALLIAFGAWRIVRQTVSILMEGTPKGIDFHTVVDEVKAVPGVQEVHDVHVWSITSGKNALSCHIVLDGNMTIRDSQKVLRDIEHRLVHMGIGHVTIQTEDGEHPHDDSEFCATSEGHHHH